jgi:hypothetical protein
MPRFPAESQMRWRRLDVPGSEVAEAHRTENGWRLTGDLHVEESGVIARLHYTIDCDSAWRTRSALIIGERLVSQYGSTLRPTVRDTGHATVSEFPMSMVPWTSTWDLPPRPTRCLSND